MSRKETPDILGALMGVAREQESRVSVMEEIQPAVKQSSNKAVKQAVKKETPRQMLIDGSLEGDGVYEVFEESKEKATFNLPVNILNDLEDKWMEIRRLSGSKQVSKTLIVEIALEMALADFELKKHTSKLYLKLVGNKAVKQ